MKRKILIIDDDPDIGEFVSWIGDDFGYDCIVTSDVATVLGSLSPATAVIFLDLKMPDMDGIQLIRLLAKQRASAQFVLMSGAGGQILESSTALAKKLGLSVLGSLQKPLGLREVTGFLERTSLNVAAEDPGISPSRPGWSLELSQALQEKQFAVHYQPQIAISDGRVVGLEALARWNHPVNGLLTPDQFLPEVESAGMIDLLTWVLIGQAFSDLGRSDWSWEGEPIPMSIKVSTGSLMDLDFPDRLNSLMTSNGIPPDRVTIDIIESGLLFELAEVLDVLIRLRLKGMRVSFNDFGMGYSMRRQLRQIPATELRIDRVFVQDMRTNPAHRDVVRQSIQIGGELGMKTLTQGVEDNGQLEELRTMQCDKAEGYAIARPMAQQNITAWLKGRLMN